MPQSTILASGTSAATSSDVVVAAGTSVALGLFSASALPANAGASVVLATPGADMPVGSLSALSPTLVITGPGTFRVVRPLFAAQAFGVFSNT